MQDVNPKDNDSLVLPQRVEACLVEDDDRKYDFTKMTHSVSDRNLRLDYHASFARRTVVKQTKSHG